VASLCPSANSDTGDAASCSGASTAGFIAFVDANSNCLREGTEEIISAVTFHSDTIGAKNMTCISYGANGFRRVVGGEPATARAIFCDDRGVTLVPGSGDISFARGLEIMPTGRAYVTRQYAEITGWGSATDSVSCP
jgi:Tfp pilus assembly protein FimT